MCEGMSVKSAKGKKQVKVNWKREPFAAGHRATASSYLSLAYKTFLLLIAIHASIFLIPEHPVATFILLLALVKGWLLAG